MSSRVAVLPIRRNSFKPSPRKEDPKEKGPTPPFNQQEQVKRPGLEQHMEPKADHGEESYQGLGRLKNCVAVITGGDSGIGKATAIAYAREGCDVAISYLKEEEEDAKDTEKWVTKAGRKCLRYPGDLANEDYCVKLIDATMKEFGKIDILINNAATQTYHDKIEEFTTEEFENTYKVNVFSMFWLCKAALGKMQKGSCIINTSSIQAFKPNPILLAYASTKAAIVNFTKGLAKQALDRGVRVNCVAPGPVWTPLIPSGLPKDKFKDFGAENEYERPAQPCEVAPIFVFLASKDASYISGEVYGVTGGMTPY